MKRYPGLVRGIVASAGMLALILDSQTALSGVAEGIDLCVRTVIPALFPFFVLSIFLTGSILGTELSFLRPIGWLCGIPKGAETILLTGLLGGYPVGAQCISQACASGQLTGSDARRMLGFCSNAGPAFIFGMTGLLFENKSVPIVLWIIHILSALMTGIILPGKSNGQIAASSQNRPGIGQVLHLSLRNTASVCGWVIIFRTILAFAQRWFLWLVPEPLQIFITGVLELTNGYIDLAGIDNDSLRFVLASVFLGFGGICVALQTASVVGAAGLSLKNYFPGKLIQTAISAILAFLISGHIFSNGTKLNPIWLMAVILPVAISISRAKNGKNSSSIPGPSGV